MAGKRRGRPKGSKNRKAARKKNKKIDAKALSTSKEPTATNEGSTPQIESKDGRRAEATINKINGRKEQFLIPQKPFILSSQTGKFINRKGEFLNVEHPQTKWLVKNGLLKAA